MAKPKLFLEKLYELLEDTNSSNIIRWTPEKDAIKIINRGQLIREILPNVFKQTSYKSFTKQMNLYNFKSTKDENGFTIFVNPHFTQSEFNIPQIMAEKRTIHRKQETKKHHAELMKEHELLKKELMDLFKYQVTLQNEIKTQLAIHKTLQTRIGLIKKCIYNRKENGLRRRRKIYHFFNQFFSHLKSSIVCQKFLILNHDLICQCDENDEVCPDFQTSRSLCFSPYLTPKNLTIFQLNSIRQMQDLFCTEENQTKSFLQLTPDHKPIGSAQTDIKDYLDKTTQSIRVQEQIVDILDGQLDKLYYLEQISNQIDQTSDYTQNLIIELKEQEKECQTILIEQDELIEKLERAIVTEQQVQNEAVRLSDVENNLIFRLEKSINGVKTEKNTSLTRLPEYFKVIE